MKHLLLAVALLALFARAYFVYLRPHASPGDQPGQTLAQTVGKLRRDAQSADAGADATAWKDAPAAPKANKAPVSVPPPAAATVAPAPTANPTANPAAVAARTEIEAALKEMHVTTIMPGQPGVFILNNNKQQDYSEGEDLPLPKGRKARIVAVQDNGVQLACEGMAFHLDPPAAPDLAALRKKR